MPAPKVQEMTLYLPKLAHRKGSGVKSADVRPRKRIPANGYVRFYPQKRTDAVQDEMSAKGQ